MLVDCVAVVLVELQKAPGMGHGRNDNFQDTRAEHAPQDRAEIAVAIEDVAEVFCASGRNVSRQAGRRLANAFCKLRGGAYLVEGRRAVELQDFFQAGEDVFAVPPHDVDAVVGDEINPVGAMRGERAEECPEE